MAILNPNIDTILKLRQEPTKGELHLIRFLSKTLSDNYEIFFQPFLNGDIPDIIIMKENAGVYIIEVKDWDLNLYSLDEKKKWYVRTDEKSKQPIKSPVSQVFNYKENLYNLHVEGLLERKIKDYRHLYIVNCGVYFHNSTTQKINNFVKQKFEIDKRNPKKYKSYLRFISYFDLFGRDSLDESFLMKVMRKNNMERTSKVFDDELYKSFKRCLSPPTHVKDQGIEITYSSEQEKVLNSTSSTKQKVKGVAGSGKTMCLAKRAVNAHKRHGEKVLILTFNISLRNYIKDKINEVRENFEWKYFHIIHYHQFFKNQANNYNLNIKSLSAWSNENFFDSVKDRIPKYKTLIIDEVQDYEEEWINLLLKYFLEEDGEYVVFGDEKQNIYQRVYDEIEKKPYTKIGGAWNLLKKSFRVSNNIARLAENFQKEYFSEKYELDEIMAQRDIFEESNLKYYLFENFNEEKIIKTYKNIAKELQIHDNDICFQAVNVDNLRSLDYKIRHKSGQRTNTMFETQEVYDKLREENDEKNKTKFKKEIKNVRRNKKFNFWNNPGLLKMSTIHSFKGWEVDTLFLIINEENNSIATFTKNGDNSNKLKFTTEELIYTAITRCRRNLFIMNYSQNKYHNFFVQQNFESEYMS